MIRINLLPVRRVSRREISQRHFLYMAFAVLVTIIGLIFFHIHEQNELDGKRRQVQSLSSDIDRMKAEIGDYDKIKAQRADLMKQQKTIQSLQTGRTGPVYLMREMSEILTAGKGPTFDRITYEERLRRDPNTGFNPSWDTRRVWLDTFEENQKRVKIRGAAKSNEDVAEFLKRLQLSVFFTDVQPDGTSQVGSAIKHVAFSLQASVVY